MLELPHAWRHVDSILETSKHDQVKYFALQILENAIKFRWGTLPKAQREGIRHYIVTKIIALSSTEAIAAKSGLLIRKLNIILVQILKQEWPHNWPSFIPEIVGSSKTSELLCTNNMAILKLLSEEVFDFSKNEMTSAKIAHLKKTLNGEFSQIFQLCDYILRYSTKRELLDITLQTLLRFMTWIPLGFIFQTKLVELLVVKFFATPAFRCDALHCLTEIGNLDTGGNAEYLAVIEKLYVGTMNSLVKHIPPNANVRAGFDAGNEEEQLLVQRLALFFTGFFKNHLKRLEVPAYQVALGAGLRYLVKISDVDDNEIFKICLEFWHYLSHDLYTTECRKPAVKVLGGAGGAAAATGARKAMYAPILTQVRLVMISHMVKPEEVLVVEDDAGDIVRERAKDTEALAQYKTMRETLVYLTHLDYQDTENIMLGKLAKQVDGSEWGWTALNTLCWAIGSISGAMSEADEKRFVVTVIKDLLGLCEVKSGKKNKAVVASNIMYVVGQYPRFLRAHWKFLKTVVLKLFEFMHEKHPGVQDMACDTFLKISQKLKRKFVMVQPGERSSFVEELCDMLPATIVDLEIHQIHTFYEAAGHMVSAHPDMAQRQRLVERVMALPNTMWQRVMANAAASLDELKKPETVREVQRIVRTNVCCCTSVGGAFIKQMGRTYLDMLNVYKAYSEYISHTVSTAGARAMGADVIRGMRGVKREILQLIQTFVQRTDNVKMISANFIPPLMDHVLGDYHRNIPNAREAEVLSLMAAIVRKLKAGVAPRVPRIMQAVFECTLQMITANFTDYPDHRLQFFKMLQAINEHCFAALFSIPPAHQKFVVHSIVWAFRHQERNICETGLDLLQKLLENVTGAGQAAAQPFYQEYFVSLLQDILWVLTDRVHKFAFKQHCVILRAMFNLLETGFISAPLFPASAATAGKTNKMFVGEHTCTLLLQYFKNLTAPQVTKFVQGLFDMTKDSAAYKQHVRDFLIELREFKTEDNSQLYAEEAAAKAETQRQAMLAVPGLVAGAHDEMDDI